MTQVEALRAIAKRDGGLLRPQAVVDEARPEESPLHRCFEWNDQIAGEKYRLVQAQQLIRSFKVVHEHDGKRVETPLFIGLSIDRTGSSGENPYRLASDVSKVPDLLAIAEHDALEQLQGVKERYSHLKKFNSIWSAIDGFAN